jgi:hypothetical protein
LSGLICKANSFLCLREGSSSDRSVITSLSRIGGVVGSEKVDRS